MLFFIYIYKKTSFHMTLYLVENPNFTICSRFWYPVAVVVEENSLLLGVSPQRCAQLLDFVYGGVQALLVTSLLK